MSRTYKIPDKNENIDEQRWNARSLNIPRTKRLSNFFQLSKEENEELFPAEEEIEEKEKESWLFANLKSQNMPKIKKQRKFKIGDKVEILPRKRNQKNQFPHYTDLMLEFAGKKAIITGINAEGLCDLDTPTNYNNYLWHQDWLKLLIDNKKMAAIIRKIKNLNNIQSCMALNELQ